jgi:hypothetical protein
MPNIDLSILNQRQTPAFFADTLANRPAAGFLGRIFVSTDTFAFYRDNGTGWDLIGGPGTGTITGTGTNGQIALWTGASTINGDSGLLYNSTVKSLTASKFIVTGGTSTQFLKGDGTLDSNTYNTGSGAASQVAFFSGTNAITGENNLWWDSVNGHLGIGTNVPTTALTIFHDQNQIIQLNQTTATNDTKIAFQNSGTPLWRIGNSYNSGANDYGIFDVVGAIQPLTIKKTTGQTFIGTQTTSSGRLVVNDATSDNHIVVIGASAPSIRINNSGSGATKRVGIGIATALNNFIQGAVDRDMCIFNGSTTPSPILFGIDSGTGLSSEAVRISSSRNLLVGSNVDTGQKLQITGEQIINSTATSSSLKINTTNVANWGTNIEFQQSGTFFGFFGSYGSLVGTTNKDLTAYSNTGNGFRVNVNNSPTSTLIISSNGISTFANSVVVTQNEGLIIAPSSGASYQNFKIGATSYSLIGIAGATNDIITGAAVGDLNVRATNSQKILFSINNGSSAAMTLSSSANLLVGKSVDSGEKLQVNGTITGNSFLGNLVLGINYPQTSSSGSTSIVNTGINYDTTNIGYNNGAMYLLSMIGNPNAGGSDAYRNLKVGYVIINTGYNGSAVTTYITYQEIVDGNATGIGGSTITAVFWDGTSESSSINVYTANVQIRIKVAGYNSSFVGTYQTIRLTKISE